MSKVKNTTTLAEIAGTNRGLSKLTVAEIKALLKGKAPAKAEPKVKAPTEFYEKVIVGGREARQNRQKVNTAAAAWMREKGLVPSGQAWTAVKNGERDLKVLRALNAADGYTAKATPKKKVTAKADEATAPKAKKAKASKAKESTVKVTEQHEAVTERDIEAEVATLIQAGFTEADARIALG